MTLTTWKRSQREETLMLECPSDRAMTVFTTVGAKIVGNIHKKGQFWWLLEISPASFQEGKSIIRKMKEDNIEFDNDI